MPNRAMAIKGIRIAKKGKISHPDMSPGCRLCHEGNWLCVYVTDMCNKDCYFCSQKKSKKGFSGIRAFTTEWLSFDDADELVSYLKYWDIKGLGISGGEPLLVMDKVVNLISCARKRLGKQAYIWLYTNGELVTREKLLRLKKAGLDEIRFDLVASGYDLKPLRLAAGIIDTVTVEIPTIPKDKEILEGILATLKDIGVKHLNLHELMVTDENLSKLKRAGIADKRTSSKTLKAKAGNVMAGKGSLKAALEIERRARKDKSGKSRLPINVCSFSYKMDVQTQKMIGHMMAVSRSVSKKSRKKRA
jgi:uncharacterized protein